MQSKLLTMDIIISKCLIHNEDRSYYNIFALHNIAFLQASLGFSLMGNLTPATTVLKCCSWLLQFSSGVYNTLDVVHTMWPENK